LVELTVVIGRRAHHVSKEQALDAVYGYTIVNDVSARDFQLAGRMADGFAPMGPWIADRAEIPDPHALSLRTWVNGLLMQDGSTRDFIFDVQYVVSYLSGIMTLSPGDVIATGTPAGVGLGRKPPVWL
jgi:2-keto-4-pentenoate hydratase/2-oxohepta-3-ene-1,7-dioic acid hydratase in catechol pathway